MEPECINPLGVTYPGGLLRHLLHGGSKAPFFCEHLDCERSRVGFSRMDNLTDHMMRVHDASEDKLQRLQPKVQVHDELKGQSKHAANPPPTPSRPMSSACRSLPPSKEDQVQEGDRTPKPRRPKPSKRVSLTVGKGHRKAMTQILGGACKDCKRKKIKVRGSEDAVCLQAFLTLSSAFTSYPRIFFADNMPFQRRRRKDEVDIQFLGKYKEPPPISKQKSGDLALKEGANEEVLDLDE